MDDSDKRYGWYSQKQFDLMGESIQYETPEGRLVYVTTVSPSSTDSHSHWDDVFFISEVTRCVKPRTYPYEDGE